MSPTSYQAAPPRGNFESDFALKGLTAVVLVMLLLSSTEHLQDASIVRQHWGWFFIAYKPNARDEITALVAAG